MTVRNTDCTGRYEAQYSYGVERLTLNTDDTYEQSLTFKNGGELTNRGTWQLVSNDHIRLTDALIVDNGFGHPATPVTKGDWVLEIRRHPTTRSMSLIVNAELGLEFNRIK